VTTAITATTDANRTTWVRTLFLTPFFTSALYDGGDNSRAADDNSVGYLTVDQGTIQA
jgi:hypothetical protein